jgi:hypothetical protein
VRGTTNFRQKARLGRERKREKKINGFSRCAEKLKFMCAYVYTPIGKKGDRSLMSLFLGILYERSALE